MVWHPCGDDTNAVTTSTLWHDMREKIDVGKRHLSLLITKNIGLYE